MFEGMLEVVRKPSQFFRGLANDDQRVGRAFLVVLLVALLTGMSAYLSALPTMDAFLGDNPFVQIGLIAAAVGAPLVTFVWWLMNGLLIRMAAGIEIKPWAIAAYSYTPQIFITALIILIAVLVPPQVSPVAADLSDPIAMQEATMQLQQQIQQSFFGVSSMILGYLATGWFLFLTFVGVREAAGANKAWIAVFLVGAITLGVTLIPFLLQPL